MSEKILIVDDNQENLNLMMRILGAFDDIEVFSGKSLNEGVMKIRQSAPDLVITDLAMPHIYIEGQAQTVDLYAGLKLSNFLLDSPETRLIPLIVVTAHIIDQEAKSQMQRLKEQVAAGERDADVISKPIDVDQFMGVVKAALQRIRERKKGLVI